MVKLAPPASVAREAAALRDLAGTGAAPVLLAAGEGVLVTGCIPGAPRPAAALTPADARAVGALVRRVHDLAPAATGEYDGWADPVDDPDAYRRRRARDIAADAGDVPAGRPIDAGPIPAAPATDAGPAFRTLHGDLWSGNVVWDGGRPVLVDWEYRRAGDPAEELAYMAAMDDLPPDVEDALIAGYGRPELAPAVGWWRPRLAAECARWYEREGDADRAAALRAQAARLLG